MTIRFINSWWHGLIDYVFGLFLIASPWLFHFNDYYDIGAPTYVVDIIGAAILTYSSFTKYELTFPFLRSLSMKTHLLLDVITSVVLIASPWLFGFATHIHKPHVYMGIAGLLIALCSKTTSPIRDANELQEHRTGRLK